MKQLEDNILMVKSMNFALRCIKMARFLRESFHEFDLASQIIRSGTSIGANAKEGLRAQSQADFISKMNIALKEANETQYWIELLYKAEYINNEQFNSMYADSTELCNFLMSIVKTSKNKHPPKEPL
jgi:four helix bundle protein